MATRQKRIKLENGQKIMTFQFHNNMKSHVKIGIICDNDDDFHDAFNDISGYCDMNCFRINVSGRINYHTVVIKYSDYVSKGLDKCIVDYYLSKVGEYRFPFGIKVQYLKLAALYLMSDITLFRKGNRLFVTIGNNDTSETEGCNPILKVKVTCDISEPDLVRVEIVDC